MDLIETTKSTKTMIFNKHYLPGEYCSTYQVNTVEQVLPNFYGKYLKNLERFLSFFIVLESAFPSYRHASKLTLHNYFNILYNEKLLVAHGGVIFFPALITA